MTETNDVRRRRFLSAFCLAALAVLFLTNPLTNITMRSPRASHGAIAAVGFAAPLSMALMIGALFGITQLLRGRADRAGLGGAALTLMGWCVGTRITAVGQLQTLLDMGVPGVSADAIQKMFESAPLVFVSMVPVGLLFPIGLLTLGLTIAAVRPVHCGIGVLLAVGGVLFPLGRAVRLEWAIGASDLVLGATFALLAWQVVTRPEAWGLPADSPACSSAGDEWTTRRSTAS